MRTSRRLAEAEREERRECFGIRYGLRLVGADPQPESPRA